MLTRRALSSPILLRPVGYAGRVPFLSRFAGEDVENSP
jgi:hypothetical protein